MKGGAAFSTPPFLPSITIYYLYSFFKIYIVLHQANKTIYRTDKKLSYLLLNSFSLSIIKLFKKVSSHCYKNEFHRSKNRY